MNLLTTHRRSMPHLLLICFLFVSACSSSQMVESGAALDSSNVLIVYLSRTGNTKAIAEIIHKNVGGKLIALELETPYSDDYKTTVNQVAKENETGYLPPLKTTIDSIANMTLFLLAFLPGVCSCHHQFNVF